jgi:hypothetical protein
MAWVPEAQAVQMVKLGPLHCHVFAIKVDRLFGLTNGTVNGWMLVFLIVF